METPFPPPWYQLHHSPSYIPLPSAAITNTPVFLTPLFPSDLARLQAILSLPSVNSPLANVPVPYTLADASFWINSISTTCLPLQAIRAGAPDASGLFIGCVGLVIPQPSATEKIGGSENEHTLGYYLDPEFQGQRIMKNAVLALLAYGQQEHGVKSVLVGIVDSNEKSQGVMGSLKGMFERAQQEDKVVDWPEAKGGGKRTMMMWRWVAVGETS